MKPTLKNVATAHPDIAKWEVYGHSTQGAPLYALKISDNVATDEDEPELMITSATHGDELITVEVMIGFIDQIIAGYKTDDRFTKMVDNHELYFIPVVNPDGFKQQDRYDNGVDPNRDYPWPESPNRNPVASIAAIMSFYNSHHFVGSIDMHAFSRLIMFPWAYTEESIRSEDEDRFAPLAAKMASTNGYTHGQISQVIYVAKGSSADYYYWKNGGAAFAYEIGDSKVPSVGEIPGLVEEMAESTWIFIENF